LKLRYSQPSVLEAPLLILACTAVLAVVILHTRPYKPYVQSFRIQYCTDHRNVLYCVVLYYGSSILYRYTTGHTDPVAPYFFEFLSGHRYPLLMGQPIMAQAPPVPSLTSSPALLPL
jgi:hypothetical protein